jgi:hypothetical protein
MQKQPQFLQQDGTSQADRIQRALDPAYVSVDERSVADLLVFAQKYSKELRYFNEQNEADGDWMGFLRKDHLEEIAAYLKNPQPLPADSHLLRPHLVLFLTFLELLQVARAQLNDLTRRHLEFYYREALRLTSQKGIPDQVHALVELIDGKDQFLLPAGTIFQAGQDSLGKELFYRSDEDLVANRASIESVKSLFAERMIIGIREARQNPDLLAELFPANKDLVAQGVLSDRTFMAMLSMALGTPGPGGSLMQYPEKRPISVSLFEELDRLLGFIPENLYMPFSTFRSLMQLKRDQEQTGGQWKRVNDTLENAGKRRVANLQLTDEQWVPATGAKPKDATFQLDRSQPDNFEKNLLAALGREKFDDFFYGLPEVDDIYDLYRRRTRDDVILFIQRSLYMTVPEFTTVLGIVEEINGRWRQIYEILRAAGRKKKRDIPAHELQPPKIRDYESDKFSSLVSKTLGTIDYSKIAATPLNNFDDCYREIIKLENYFHVTAEEFVFIRNINKKGDEARPWEWEQIYAILEDAHAEKALIDRRSALKAINTDKTRGFNAMMLFALGDPQPGKPGLILPDGKEFKKLNPELSQDKDYITEQLFLELANFQYIKNTNAKGTDATEEEWSNVYAILEKAQWRKRGWKESRAEIEKWDNIYVAADATQVQVRLDAEGKASTPRWRTFGEGYSSQPGRTTPANIGFAIASPLLALAEGTRTITLTIAFREERFNKADIELALKAPWPFRFLLSSEKEMVTINDKNVNLQLIDTAFSLSGAEKPYQHALQITLSLNEQAPAVAPLKIAPTIQTPWPVLQIMLDDIPDETTPIEGSVKRYRAFQSLALEKVHLKVDVLGLTTLTLQNDNGLLDSKKPFEPFGMSPVTGSSFYIAHPELCAKRLDELRLNIDWLGAPDDLSSYYLGYKDYADPEAAPASPITDNTSFKASLKLYDNRSFFNIGNIQLFNAAGAQKNTGAAQTNAITINAAAIKTAYPSYGQDIHPLVAQEVLDWHRYWQVELLAPDFQHSLYPRAAAGCANKIEKGSSPSKSKPFIVNAPYTPKIKRMTMGYSASLEIDLTPNPESGAGKTDLSTLADKFYHIEPFGYRDLAGNDPKLPYLFLPQYENEGELYIGIKNLKPPQNLSLLFQMAEGSADPDVAREEIQWSFLDGNRWQSLEEGRLLSDTTNGLLNSGILKFDLAPVEPSTLLPTNLYWIRAIIAKNSRSVGDTVAIKTQVVSATFIDQGNAPDHLSQPLQAESITGLAETKPEVKDIHQPYSSFGGKSPEQAGSFYTRVSERLRHKNRALTSWDYEHMVLETFSGIFKVKCLPVGASEDPRLADVIQVIVIPDIHGKLPFDPFEPKLPADTLFQIEQYLTKHCSPFARFKVKNPTYLRLKVRLGVRLRPGANPGYYKNALIEELQRYLAPWAYDRSAEIVFGGEINTSLIVNFVEERPYVDYVAGIKLFISADSLHFTPYTAGDRSVFAPDAIIVSDRSHQVDLITEEGYEAEYFTGINYMKLELDFQIAAG